MHFKRRIQGLFITLSLIFGSSPGLAYEFPEIKDYTNWDLPELNPTNLRVGRFYYGILIDGKIYISVIRDKQDAPIGLRAGGHFKLLKGSIIHSELQKGLPIEKALEAAQKAQELQARTERFHQASAFGFKPVEGAQGQIVLKWHGFNSFKSTIHKTKTLHSREINELALMTALTKRYQVGHQIAHPLNDQDMLVNPKYLDINDETYYRGEDFLWHRTAEVAEYVKTVNEFFGYDNSITISILSEHHFRESQCGGLMARANRILAGMANDN